MNELTTEPQHVLVEYKPSKRHKAFIEAYFTPGTDTFGNAYQSGLVAGYSKSQSRVITAKRPDWLTAALRLYARDFTPEHIYLGLQQLAQEARQDRDKIRSLELMAKIKGMFIERSQSDVQVTFNNNVPRPNTPIIDSEIVE